MNQHHLTQANSVLGVPSSHIFNVMLSLNACSKTLRKKCSQHKFLVSVEVDCNANSRTQNKARDSAVKRQAHTGIQLVSTRKVKIFHYFFISLNLVRDFVDREVPLFDKNLLLSSGCTLAWFDHHLMNNLEQNCGNVKRPVFWRVAKKSILFAKL